MSSCGRLKYNFFSVLIVSEYHALPSFKNPFCRNSLYKVTVPFFGILHLKIFQMCLNGRGP